MRKACPVCKCKSHRVLETMRFVLPESFHLPSSYDVVTCTSCGFCFAVTQAELEDYEHYYRECNFYSGVPNESIGKRALNQKIAAFVKGMASKEDFLLDIGFGKGNLMRQLRQNGFCNVFGLDPSLESVERMKEEGFDVYLGSIFNEAKEPLQKKFDYVFLIDVLEHLLYPENAIECITDYIKERGKLVVSVPNDTSLMKDLSPIPNHFNQEHINYFSPVSLDNLLATKNFYRIKDSALHCEDGSDSELVMVYYYKSDGVPFELKKDNICSESLVRFFEQNRGLAEQTNRKISAYTSSGKPVYIWGTGAYTMWLLANTRMGELNIKAFIDNNSTKIGSQLAGKKIIHPNEIESEIPIIICVMKCPEKVTDQIRQISAADYTIC